MRVIAGAVKWSTLAKHHHRWDAEFYLGVSELKRGDANVARADKKSLAEAQARLRLAIRNRDAAEARYRALVDSGELIVL